MQEHANGDSCGAGKKNCRKQNYRKKNYQAPLLNKAFIQQLMLALVILAVKGFARIALIKLGMLTVEVAWNPYGYAPDVAQFILEFCGKQEVGQGVGVVGNIGLNAIIGAKAGGPGLIIGLLVGGVLWLTGEIARIFLVK